MNILQKQCYSRFSTYTWSLPSSRMAQGFSQNGGALIVKSIKICYVTTLESQLPLERGECVLYLCKKKNLPLIINN